MTLHKDNAEKEAADHLSHEHKQQPLANGQVAEHQAKIPSIMYNQAQSLIPALLLFLHHMP